MRCWQPFLPSCVYLLHFTFFTNTNARPPYEVAIAETSLRNSDHDIPATLPLSQSTPLAPRSLNPVSSNSGFQAFLHLGAGWNLYYSSWIGTSFPTQPAAWALSHLYSSMVTNAGSIWRLSPPLHRIPLRVGNVDFLMECSDEPIPWDLVVLFGRRLLAITNGGWTGLYQLMLSHAESGMTVDVVLRVANEGIRRVQGM